MLDNFLCALRTELEDDLRTKYGDPSVSTHLSDEKWNQLILDLLDAYLQENYHKLLRLYADVLPDDVEIHNGNFVKQYQGKKVKIHIEA